MGERNGKKGRLRYENRPITHGLTELYCLGKTSLMVRFGGVIGCPTTEEGSGSDGGRTLCRTDDDDGRGEGSVSTGDTIIANEGESVCCIARAGTDAGGSTGVCGFRRACFGDREPDAETEPEPELELGPE